MKGCVVKTKGEYNFGLVTDVFDSWADLKSKCTFEMFDDDTISNIDRLINDPRDKWLRKQKEQITVTEINNNWIAMRRLFGGISWIPVDKIEIVISRLN